MRNFEQDFDFEKGINVPRIKDCRIDTYPTVVADKTVHSDNAERKARIVAHIDRVQRELKAQGI